MTIDAARIVDPAVEERSGSLAEQFATAHSVTGGPVLIARDDQHGETLLERLAVGYQNRFRIRSSDLVG